MCVCVCVVGGGYVVCGVYHSVLIIKQVGFDDGVLSVTKYLHYAGSQSTKGEVG